MVFRKTIREKISKYGIKPTDIDCMLISHHHGDHGGVEIAMKKWDIPVKCNYFTAEKLGLLNKENLDVFEI